MMHGFLRFAIAVYGFSLACFVNAGLAAIHAPWPFFPASLLVGISGGIYVGGKIAS